MSEQTAPEPTMEEILASIRRIISEDEAPGAHAAGEEKRDSDWAPPAAEASTDLQASDQEADDVLELTERAPAEPASETHGDVDVYAAKPQSELAVEASPAPEAAAAFEPKAFVAAEAPSSDSELVCEPVAASAASAFDRLSASLAKPTPPPIAPVAMPASGRTLEDLTRELLRPLLKSWLDENLGSIVQARVDEEVERISRGRVR